MAKCRNCSKKIGLRDDFYYDGDAGEYQCITCGQEKAKQVEQERKAEQKKKLEEAIAKAPKIKCPYCEQWFPKLTNEQYRESAELNVLKWAVVPAWGVVGALKNKPFIECPKCKMKIMQG